VDEETSFRCFREGRIDLLEGVIKAGMDPNAGDPRGFTPLTLADYNGQAETVDFAIGKDADPRVTDPNGNTALMDAAFKGETKRPSGC
jgi:hypothetical protein